MHQASYQILQSLLFRPRCWGCGEALRLKPDFCPACRRQLLSKSLQPERYLIPFGGPVKPLLQALRGEAPFLAARWCERLIERQGCLEAWREAGISLVTVVPRARPKREDGLPLLAQKIAARLGAEFRETLQKEKGRSQHGLNRGARMDTAPFLKLRKGEALGKAPNVLLLDDVDTTGTTLELAAYRLREAGAARVLSFSVARHMMESFERKREEPEDEGKEVEPLLLHLFV